MNSSDTFTADAPSQLNVLRHDRHPLRVNCAQIRILEQADHVGLARLLDCEHSLALEPQIALVLSGDLPHEALERQLANEQLSRLLELANLTKSDCAGTEPMWLLDALVSHICCFARRFLGELLARGLRPSILAGSLFSASHLLFVRKVFCFSICAITLILESRSS